MSFSNQTLHTSSGLQSVYPVDGPHNSYEPNYNLNQMQLEAHASHIDPSLHLASSGWGLPTARQSAGPLNFSNGNNADYKVPMRRQNSIASAMPPRLQGARAFDFGAEQNGHYGTPMSRQNSTASTYSSFSAATQGSNSPESRISPSLPILDSFDHKLECQWQLDGNQLCGMVFETVQEFNSHVVKHHVQDQHPPEKGSYVCRWFGCVRQTSDHHDGTCGFEARSKLKRHIQIHTGSGTYCI